MPSVHALSSTLTTSSQCSTHKINAIRTTRSKQLQQLVSFIGSPNQPSSF